MSVLSRLSDGQRTSRAETTGALAAAEEGWTLPSEFLTDRRKPSYANCCLGMLTIAVWKTGAILRRNRASNGNRQPTGFALLENT